MAKSKLPYDRLTFDGNFCDIAQCYYQRWGKYCPDGACSQRKVWERLKKYENTTLSPDDVREYKKFEDGLIASGMTLNDLLARAPAGMHFTSVEDRLPNKDCQCLCIEKFILHPGYIYTMRNYHAKSFINSWDEEAIPGFYHHGEDCEFLADEVIAWVELPDDLPAQLDDIRLMGVGCVGCKWDGKRHQKCSCCRRNLNMKDNWEAES